VLGFDRSDLEEPILTNLKWPPLNDPFVITYYFETDLMLGEARFDRLQSLSLTHFVDDGAAFYINGVEIPGSRLCLPEGEISATTLATCDDDAVRVGPVTVPIDLLQAGPNRFSVEVHQGREGSSDVAFGASLSAIYIEENAVQPQPYREIDEEWIELYNRSDEAIDLSGWTFDRGIDFRFPDGTMLGADSYLIIANDHAALAAKYPDMRIIGDFEGGLNNGSDHLVLRDAARNPVDAVRYFDGGRWPEAADVNGSSMELRSPFSDNSVAETWAASDESGRSEWRTFRYRGRGDKFGRSSEPTQYHEFIFGLLDDGEFLIDDVSVIENPEGEARELIQDSKFNGTLFSDIPTRWRLLGTHGLHGRSRIVEDPIGTGKVLHVVAMTGCGTCTIMQRPHSRMTMSLPGFVRTMSMRFLSVRVG
jgi:hypothetical protein